MTWRRRSQACRPDGLTCRDAAELLTDRLEGAMQHSAATRLDDHLAGCADCSEHLAQLQAAVVLLGRLATEPVDEATLDRLVSLYRQWTEAA